MPCLPGDMPQGTDNAQPPLNTDSPLHWEVQQHWEEIEAEIARHPPSPPSPPSSPPTPHDTQETHEQQAFRLGRNIPAFLDRDLVDSFRPIYLVADFLFRTNHPVQFGLKHCLYQLLLPPAVYWEWRFITYPPALHPTKLSRPITPPTVTDASHGSLAVSECSSRPRHNHGRICRTSN